jgi:hypothetical protein
MNARTSDLTGFTVKANQKSYGRILPAQQLAMGHRNPFCFPISKQLNVKQSSRCAREVQTWLSRRLKVNPPMSVSSATAFFDGFGAKNVINEDMPC